MNDIVTEGIYECVRECAGQSPCNGRAPLHLELYDTFTECCHERTWWKPSCVSSSSHNTEPGTSLLSSITEPGMSAGSASSKCSDTFWDTYQQWDSVGYYPVCEFLVIISLNLGQNTTVSLTFFLFQTSQSSIVLESTALTTKLHLVY